MAIRKNWSAEQIEVQMAQGNCLALACKEAESSEQNSRTSA
jgi:ribosomal protein L10